MIEVCLDKDSSGNKNSISVLTKKCLQNQGCMLKVENMCEAFIYDPEGICSKALFYEACTQKCLQTRLARTYIKLCCCKKPFGLTINLQT